MAFLQKIMAFQLKRKNEKIKKVKWKNNYTV